MNEEKNEFYQRIYTRTQLKRKNVVNDYISEFRELIKERKVTPNRAWELLADKYELSKAGVRHMLKNAGVYKGKENPVYVPTEEERSQNPLYFF